MNQLSKQEPATFDNRDKPITNSTDRTVATVRTDARTVIAASTNFPAVSTDTMQLQVQHHRAAVLETLRTRWDVISSAVEKSMACPELAERLLKMREYIQMIVEGRDLEIFRIRNGYLITISNGVEETIYQIDEKGEITTFRTRFYKGANGEGDVVPAVIAGPSLYRDLLLAQNQTQLN